MSDLSDLFAANAIPAAPSFSVRREPVALEQHTGQTKQAVHVSHETKTLQLDFADPSGPDVTYDTRVLPVTPAP